MDKMQGERQMDEPKAEEQVEPLEFTIRAAKLVDDAFHDAAKAAQEVNQLKKQLKELGKRNADGWISPRDFQRRKAELIDAIDGSPRRHTDKFNALAQDILDDYDEAHLPALDADHAAFAQVINSIDMTADELIRTATVEAPQDYTRLRQIIHRAAEEGLTIVDPYKDYRAALKANMEQAAGISANYIPTTGHNGGVSEVITSGMPKILDALNRADEAVRHPLMLEGGKTSNYKPRLKDEAEAVGVAYA